MKPNEKYIDWIFMVLIPCVAFLIVINFIIHISESKSDTCFINDHQIDCSYLGGGIPDDVVLKWKGSDYYFVYQYVKCPQNFDCIGVGR